MLPVALHVTVLSSSSCAFLPPLSLVSSLLPHGFWASTSFLSTRSRLLGWTPAFSFSLKSSDGSTGEYHSRNEDILEDVTLQWIAVFLINNFYKIFVSFGLGFLHVSEVPLRRGSWILWNWRYRQLCTTWELNSGPLQTQLWALSHWEISLVPTALFLNVTVLPMTNTISLKANSSFKYLGWIQALQWVQAGTETEMSRGLGKLFRSRMLSIHGA